MESKFRERMWFYREVAEIAEVVVKAGRPNLITQRRKDAKAMHIDIFDGL